MEAKNCNKDYANKVSLEQWLKDHKDHGSVDELTAIYNELQDEKPKKK